MKVKQKSREKATAMATMDYYQEDIEEQIITRRRTTKVIVVHNETIDFGKVQSKVT